MYSLEEIRRIEKVREKIINRIIKPIAVRKEEVVRQEEEEDIEDLFIASESSLDFWDNPIDDDIWNDV
jgi:hypothetical protein